MYLIIKFSVKKVFEKFFSLIIISENKATYEFIKLNKLTHRFLC